METKPLNVLAAEACGFTCVQGVGLGNYPYWAIECGPNTPPRSLPHYHTDDAAALELLKAWESVEPDNRWFEIRSHTDKARSRLVILGGRGVNYSRAADKSLARAICLALVAAKESH